jgi:hypothetical protein
MGLSRATLLRVFACVTLGAFIALAATEAFHAAREGHVDSHCAVCQIMHHTPPIGQGAFHFKVEGHYSPFTQAVFLFTSAEQVPDRRSRSPPIA